MSVANPKHTRKSTTIEEKDKKPQSDSPSKEMMKKLAAKEKDKKDKDPPKDKTSEKAEVDKSEKKQEKSAEKKEEKPKEDKGEKSGKTDKPEKKPDQKPKPNSNSKPVHNGVCDVTLSANGGGEEVLNGTVSPDSDEDEAVLVIDDQDELFPELTYDETSDNESFELPTPENAPSRSLTRRSQVKSARTPETPRPISEKAVDHQPADDNSKEKVLKLKDDTPSSDRKLRSSDSPRRESKSIQEATKDKSDKEDGDNKEEDKVEENKNKSDITQEGNKDENKDKCDKIQGGDKIDKTGEGKESQKERADVVIDITQDDTIEKGTSEEKNENNEVEIVVEIECEEGPRKLDTNYSKSRVKVSPYRRSMRLADQAETSTQADVSVLANYTGNNTTMEMDITESSFLSEEGNHDDSSYLRGLRAIRGRSSYKPLKEITLKHVNRSARSTISLTEQQSRPTGTVVGRKRKPDTESEREVSVERASEATEYTHVAHKRMRLLDRISMPFRRTATLPTVGQNRRAAEIVGINTDLPLTAPVSSEESFDPESLKAATPIPLPLPHEPVATPLPPHHDRDSKRCIIV